MVSKFRFIGRILVFYLCVLIPMVCVSLLITESSFQQAKEREERIMQSILQDVARELDDWYSDFQNQAITLGARRDMSPTVVLSNAVDEQEAVNQLGFAKVFSSKISEIVLYYGEGKVYTSQGLTSLPVYFDTTLNCTKESTIEAVEALSATASVVVLLQTENQQDLLMYHYPIRSYASKYMVSLQIIVSVNQIKNMLEAFGSECELMLKMPVGDEALYFQVQDGECTVLKQEKFIELQKEKNHILRKSLSYTNIELELYFDPNASWAELRRLQNVNLGLLAVGIFLSVVISVVLSRHRWGRFQSLANTLTVKTYSNSEVKPFNDEFGYIQSILEQSRRECEQVEQNAQTYRHRMIRQTAMMIFHGMNSKPESIQQMLQGCNLELPEAYFYICGIMLESETVDIRSCEDVFADHLYCEAAVESKRVILFLEETAFIDQDCVVRQERMNRLCEELFSIDITVSRIVSSRVYDKLSRVNYAYLETISLLENLLHSDEFTECWDNKFRPAPEKLTQIQSEHLEIFIKALEHRAIRDAEVALDSMLREEISKGSAENQYYLRFCIRQALILAIRSDDSEQSSALMSEIVQINPAEETHFTGQFLKILRAYCDSDKRSEQLEAVVEYMKKNYRRYDLSKEEVAIHAGINKTQMSKLFKEQLGTGYLEYLTSLRMQEAQELLAHTDQTVKSILQNVGYIDQTSFTKKFKACYGMSPMEYRCRSKEIMQETNNV